MFDCEYLANLDRSETVLRPSSKALPSLSSFDLATIYRNSIASSGLPRCLTRRRRSVVSTHMMLKNISVLRSTLGTFAHNHFGRKVQRI